jgi:hypothetical protein
MVRVILACRGIRKKPSGPADTVIDAEEFYG